MSLEQRQTPRKRVGAPAWVKVYSFGIQSLVPVTISDASAGGARLTFRSARDTPAQFELYLSPTAQSAKRCRVVWRTRDAIGVEFLG